MEIYLRIVQSGRTNERRSDKINRLRRLLILIYTHQTLINKNDEETRRPSGTT